MPDQFRLNGRPVLNRGRQGSTPVAVLARPDSHVVAAQAPDADVNGLIQGLAAFYPEMQRHFQQEEVQERDLAAEEAAADAQRIANPAAALEGPMVAPADAPAAYSSTYRQELSRGLANRAASQIKADTLAEYAAQRDNPDFDAETWLGEKRQKALAGLASSTSVAVVGTHFSSLEEQIMGDVRQQRMKRLEEVNASTVASYASETFTGNMSPQQLSAAYPVFLEKAKGLGLTPKEANVYMLSQLEHESNKLGGAPELFDVFDQPGADGKAIRFYNPELAGKVDALKAQAKQARDKGIEKQAEAGNAVTLMELEDDINKDPAKVTPERLLSHMTPFGAIPSAEKAAALWDKAQDALRAKHLEDMGAGLYDKGELWRVDAKVQDKVLTARLAPAIEMLAQATRTGDPSMAAQVGAQIMQAQSRSGSTVPSDQLVRFIKTNISALPRAEGPSPAFEATASLYRAMSANPQYRDLYFDEKTQAVMEAYSAETSNGSDAKGAYNQAYASVSPEAKAAAEAYVKTPEFTTMVKKESAKWAAGAEWYNSFVPEWMGGPVRPDNIVPLSGAVTWEMKTWRSRNPYATDDQAEKYAEKWVRRNYVVDETFRTAVKVPPGLSGPAAQEAITAYSKRVADQLSLKDLDGDWSVQFVPHGTEGQYAVSVVNGSSRRFVGPVSLKNLIHTQAATKAHTADEHARIGAAIKAYSKGELVDLDPALLAKGVSLKSIPEDLARAYRTRDRQQFMDRVKSIPAMSFGKPSFDNLQFVPGKASKVDNQLTARSALEFARNPAFDQATKHVPLSASLITMGEAVMLTAYDDPARGAGKNIGMGYNLSANKDNATADLARAGVPKERISDVIEGRASLTQKQAERLLLVALPRYEKSVKDTAEGTSPGLWERMSPTQKAVMVDVAWQVGDPAQFKKAWASLAAGDHKAFSEQTKVTYVNKAGTRVEDTRRNNLRASMLAGFSQWEATVQKYGSLPSSKLQAALIPK